MEKRQKQKNIFKLIAIQPLDCAPCILKNLKNGEIYYFYKGYSIKDDQITFEESLMNDDFYMDENSGLNISIHTIVGKNGSGKSAIVELLMRVLNNIAYILHVKEKDPLTTIYPVPQIKANLFYQLNNTIYRIQIEKLINEERNGNMYYPAVRPELSATILKMNSREKECDINSMNPSFIKKFFYTIVVNYAVYAYNGNDFGDQEFFVTDTTHEKKAPILGFGKGDGLWIDNIMHKNDGYSAPLVIHPQRTDGNIDINKEKHLTISRLLTLFVKMDKRDKVLNILNEKNEISKVQFTMDENDLNTFNPETNASKLNYYFKKIPNSYLFSIDLEQPELFEKFKQICEIIFKEWINLNNWNKYIKDTSFEIINKNIEYNYLVYKSMMMINRYIHILAPESKYNYHFAAYYKLTSLSESDLNKEISYHIHSINNDDSHITIKLKQTLNYIKHTRKEYSKERYKNHEIALDEFLYSEYSPIEFNDALNVYRKEWGGKVSDILYFMPPPFFKTKIFYKDLKYKNYKDEEYPFDFLSSGEKQFTFFITTILYHLRNIESAHKSRTNRKKFENINLIFEEIDLYFHPEMQRNLVENLIKSLRVMNFEFIKNINICLVTHSPIILSDIPTTNGLFLKDGNPEMIGEETFASNIYSLFRNAFFLDGAPIGEFAVKKIKKLCENIEKNELSDSDLLNEINQIGDPIIKSQVMKLFEKRYNTVMKIQKLEEEIKQLKLKLNDKNK